MARDLTTLAAVKKMIGGDANSTTTYDPIISGLITQASEMLHREANREFIGVDDVERTFEIGHQEVEDRMLDLGAGLKTNTPTYVKIFDPVTATVVETCQLALIEFQPYVRQAWEPYQFLYFLPGSTSSAQNIRRGYRFQIRGNWGFPAVPDDVTWIATKQAATWFERDYARESQSFQRQTDKYDLDIGVRHAIRRYRLPTV